MEKRQGSPSKERILIEGDFFFLPVYLLKKLMGAPAPMTSVLSLTYQLPVLIAVLYGIPKQGLNRSYATFSPRTGRGPDL